MFFRLNGEDVPRGTLPDALLPLVPQRSHSAYSITGEDAPKTPSLEAASGHRGARGQHPRDESVLPSWKSVDRLDERSNGFKLCQVGSAGRLGAVPGPLGCRVFSVPTPGQPSHQVTRVPRV